MESIRKLRLLVWKNMLLRKRHYILTILELILPAVFAIALSLIQNKSPSEPFPIQTELVFPVKDEMSFRAEIQGTNCTGWGYSELCRLAYYPNNTATTEVMEALSLSLNLTSSGVSLEGFPSERAIEIEVLRRDLSLNNHIVAAIIFEDALSELTSVSYKIRMNHRPHISQKSMNNLGPFDKQIMGSFFPWEQQRGPNLENARRYDGTGFTTLQIFLDKILINRLTGITGNETIPSPNYTYSVQAFPYPPHRKPDINGTAGLNKLLQIFLPNTVVLGFMFIIPSIVGVVVSERETGIKELMKLSGIPNWMHWLAWMIISMMCFVVSVSIVIIVLFTNVYNSDRDPILTQSDWSVWWFILFWYATSATAFCFFVSSFFQKPIIAIISAIIVWLTTYYAPAVPLLNVDQYRSLTLTGKLSVAILPNMALSWALKVMSEFEANGDGFRWENFADPISTVDDMALHQLFIMFIVDTIVYLLLTLYIEAVIPSAFGIPKPWYFLFQADTWYKKKQEDNNSDAEEPEVTNEHEGKPQFQVDSPGLQVGVEIKNMKKVFGSHTAVAGVSLKMFAGDIFALLGHNGAGKTTTISCCTGMIPPTSGTAKINGFDILTQPDKVRKHLGVCPQQDFLFNELTVDEHLKFFGSLKGLKSSVLKEERQDLIQKLQLAEKTNVQSIALSGGQKRKLCLGIALIGKAKVVFLDEPTSGMDVEARRAIWDLLLEERGHRTIILTTHFMEEADFLGDRIGIMADGKLQCVGSPMFLKKCYGTGYTLNLTTTGDTKELEILSVIQKHIPNASVKEENRKLKELPINMPIDPTSTSMSMFPEMFKDLSDRKASLEIKSIGLSLTTMDEVFIKVGQVFSNTQILADPKALPDLINETTTIMDDTEENLVTSVEIEIDNGQLSSKIQEDGPIQGDTVGTELLDQKTEEVVAAEFEMLNIDEELSPILKETDQAELRYRHGFHLLYLQFWGLLIKRARYSMRKWALIIVQFVFPVFLVIVAILSANKPLVIKYNQPLGLQMKLSSYKRPIILYSAPNTELQESLENAVGKSELVSTDDLVKKLLRIGKTELAVYRERHIVAFDVQLQNIKAMFSTIPYHSSPLAVNLASNAILRILDKKKRSLRISVTNFPLQNKDDYFKEADKILKLNAEEVWTKSIVFGILTPIGLALLAGSFIVAPLEEKICKAKQLQLMTGLSPISYWSSFFIWDYFVMVLVIIIMVGCFPIFQNGQSYTSYGGAWTLFLILILYGSAAIPFSYVWSLFSDGVIPGFSLVTIFHIFTGILFSFAAYTLEEVGKESLAKYAWYIGVCFPTFGASYTTMRFIAIALQNSKCTNLPINFEDYLCDSSVKVPDNLRQCCSDCIKNFGSCFKPVPYITWSYKRQDNGQTKTFDVAGIGQMLVVLFILGILYHILLTLLELKFAERVVEMFGKTNKSAFRTCPDDDDVATEAGRVEDLVQSGDLNEDALIIQNLCKNYGSFAAVSNLSVGVHYGECFGLLGVNGAGKTTTFRMLTGDDNRSNGNSYLSMLNLDQDRKKFLANIGYCPQTDAIVGVLTGQEMVELFCRLRGVESVQKEADEWLERVGLSSDANIQCRKYSGGMKRRLSAAMALVGNPQIIMLDEPTSGVDPISRREFWKVILFVRASGRAVILTSHSMDEIGTCCDRVGIMVNGQFQCLGSAPHLKNKFAQGYTLSIKLKSMVSHDSDYLKAFDTEIINRFSPCTLVDRHQTSLAYQIHNAAFAWDVLFKTMEELKVQYEDLIEEYSIMESTLEEVFLSFARKQYPERKAKVSTFGNICRCIGR